MINLKNSLVNQRNQQKNLLILAIVFQVLWLSIVNIGFHCDSPAYFSYAWKLLGDPADSFVLWVRGISYPLLILTSGAVGGKFSFSSFAPLILLQSIMGILIPIMSYKILSHINKNFAYLVSIIIIISLQTVITSKLIMTEQSYKFFSIFIIFTMLEIIYKNRINLNYFILSISSFFIVFLKPQSIILVLLCYFVLFIKNSVYCKKNIYSFGFFCSLFFINSHLVSLSIPPDSTIKNSSSISDKVAYLAFFTIYMDGYLKNKNDLTKFNDIFSSYSDEFNINWLNNYPNRNIKLISVPGFNFHDYFFTSPNAIKYKDLKDIVDLYSLYGKNSALKTSSVDLIKHYSITSYFSDPKLIFLYFYENSFFRGGGSSQLLFNKLFSEYQSIKFDPNSGLASLEFSNIIRDYLLSHSPDYKGFVPDYYFTNYKNVDDFLVNHLYGIPDARFFFNYWLIIDQVLGHSKSDKLFSRVVNETLVHDYPQNPLLGLRILLHKTKEQSLRFLFDPYLNFDYFYKIVSCLANTSGGKGARRWEWELTNGWRLIKTPAVIPNKPIDEVGTNWFANHNHWFINADSLFDKYVGWTWVLMHYISAMIIVFLMFFGLLSNLRIPILFIGIYLTSQALISSSLVYAQIRYVDSIMPLAIILAGLCLMGTIRVINSSFRMLTIRS